MKENQVDYQKLLVSFFAGEISDDEIMQLKTWIESDAANRRKFDIENEIWQNSSGNTKPENYKSQTAWNDISAKLGLGNQQDRPLVMISRSNFRLLMIAASVACIMALGGIGLLFIGKDASFLDRMSSTLITTGEGERSRILLADSTMVILNAGSSLQYNGNYNKKERSVKLTGEAFFDVHTNSKKPFKVHIDQMIISATGTRFNVFSFSNENRVETTLEEGHIEVIVKGNKPIPVRAGQQVVYYKRSKQVKVADVNTESYTAWKENKLCFLDAPFSEVMRKLARKHNVEIYVQDPALYDFTFTATFIDESIEEIMKMLSAVSPMTFKINNRAKAEDAEYLKPQIVVNMKKVLKK